jgi:hypothetical protein
MKKLKLEIKSYELVLKRGAFHYNDNDYVIMPSEFKTRKLFEEIIGNFYRGKGVLVIYGVKDGKMEILELFKANENLKNEFRESKINMDGYPQERLLCYYELLKEKKYNKFRFYLGKYE